MISQYNRVPSRSPERFSSRSSCSPVAGGNGSIVRPRLTSERNVAECTSECKRAARRHGTKTAALTRYLTAVNELAGGPTRHLADGSNRVVALRELLQCSSNMPPRLLVNYLCRKARLNDWMRGPTRYSKAVRSTVGNVTVAGNAFFAREWWAQSSDHAIS
jgi:hypothetical protein